MREVAPGDLIFSFMDTRILAVGIAESYCCENPKPLEFGTSGQNWENVGWRVRVRFTELVNKGFCRKLPGRTCDIQGCEWVYPANE
jgi:putative restriction endonuclease